MTEIRQLLNSIKQQLKLQGKTYRDVATALDLSEASIKRLLSAGNGANMSIERLAQISNLLGYSLMEITQEANASHTRIHSLSTAQEKELVSDTKLLLVAVCALNHWKFEEILQVYQFSKAECLSKLLRLDKLNLISLMPNNRIRLNIARDFDWLPQGPIRQYFHHTGMADFLNAPFSHEFESQHFIHGMLTEAAAEKFQSEIRQLRQKLAELHTESLSSPLKKRRGTAVLLAMREWEPASFTALRKT
ncbi:helix-turn-helix domain-containing protein [Undibacterium pigrum]|uniref:Xre family transcriptional regulator n=1 Tax=Undibacterium pigrum TaxID=401470 RepID=A0A318JQN9_9BURK|nr:helix-turn-helix transcriptional regulator [Undibacterium pigrum]PXX46650.1 Xre family transcriptional regulator [Undibacterium pigrum]